MAIQEVTEEVQAANLTEFRESLQWKSMESAKDRKHEKELRDMDISGNLKLEKLKAEAATARLRATTRSDLWRRVLIAFVKAPGVPFALLFVFILELAGHDTPESLESYLDL